MTTTALPLPRAPRRLTEHQARLVDILLVVVVVIGPAAVLAAGLHDGRSGVSGADIAALVAFVPLVLLRRHWPVAVLASGTVAAVLITAISTERTVALPAEILLLCTMAARTPRHLALLYGGAAELALFVAAATRFDDRAFAPDSFAVLAWSSMALAVGDASRTRRAYVAAVEERARRAEESRETEARQRVTEERLRIARELHDVVAHHLAVINVQAGVATHLLRNDPAGAASALVTVRDAGRSVIEEMSELLNVLRSSNEPAAFDEPQPTLRQLDGLIASFNDAGLHVTYRSTGEVPLLSEATQLTVYRVVEEALTNAHKYGDGHAVVQVTHALTDVDVQIDNRIATAPSRASTDAAGNGFGLVGMRERVSAAGGTIETGAQPNSTFRVHVHLPVHAGAPA